MVRSVKSSGLRLALLLTAVAVASPCAYGAASGNLQGVVQDQAGHPLANILVSLIQKSSEEAIPILARTNETGGLLVSKIEPGDYTLSVRSAGYRLAGGSAISISPGKTAVIRLVLQDLLNAEGDDQNIGLTPLLRTSTARRMIFRDSPEPLEDTAASISPFDSMAFQVYTNGGVRDDYVVFPGDSSQGASTNFALVNSFLGNNRYILAGQLNSGENSLWRLKNVIEHEIGDIQSVKFFLGYSRLSFQQPRLALLENPIALGNEVDYVRAEGRTRMMNLGFEDNMRFGDSLAIIWGLELNQIRHTTTDSYFSPNARISYSPTNQTSFELVASSRRPSNANIVRLPDGESVNLDDSMHLARVGDQLTYGTSRYYQASVTQRLTDSSEVELARFSSRREGGTLPFVAMFDYQPGREVVQLADDQAWTRGHRVSFRHRFSPNLKTSVSYTRAAAVGLPTARIPNVAFDDSTLGALVGRHDFNAFAAQIDAVIPRTKTAVTGLIKVLPDGRPVTTLDPYSDVYETGNDGVNLFVRQVIPVPAGFLNLIGLDFLPDHQLEALLDVRNVVNQNLGVLETAQGEVVLMRAPRSVRGGIALKF